MNKQTWDTSGYQDRQDHIRDLVIEPKLETIENIYSDREYSVNIRTTEFSSVCPKTGLPDFADIEIEYGPDRYLVEEKALKLYLVAYRNLGIFQENATNKILNDFCAAVSPRWAKIRANWNNRGGLSVIVTAEWKKK